MNLLEIDLLVSSDDVANFLPQQAPFIMVDTLVETTESTAVSQFLIKPDNVLVNDGTFQESGLIENIAQTIALKAGYEAVLRNEKPQVGFIVQIKDLEIFEYPRVGDIITTNIEITMNLQQMLVIKGESFSRNKPLITCEMRVFIDNQMQS
jgi:predicted hotdog family 3-hydroxylacyl-ACP dehydratase